MLISLGFMEKQTRISIRCNFIPMSLAKFRSLTRSPTRDIVDQWLVRCKLEQAVQKIVWHYLAKLNTHIPSNPVIAFPAVHPTEMLALGTRAPETYIYKIRAVSAIAKKLATTQPVTNRKVDQ